MASYGLVAVLVLGLWSSSSDGRPSNSEDGALEKRQGTGCGRSNFDNEEGFIKTPNYPAVYGNGMDCTYTIQTNSTIEYVGFHICDCDIEDASACRYDYIEFGSEKICGRKNGQSYTVNTNTSKVDVRFHSDGSVVRSGCNVAYGVNRQAWQLANNCPSSNGTSTTPSWGWSTAFPSNNTSPSWNWNYTTPSWIGNSSSTAFPSNNTFPLWNYTTSSWSWDFSTTAPPSNRTLPDILDTVYALAERVETDWFAYKRAVRELASYFNVTM